MQIRRRVHIKWDDWKYTYDKTPAMDYWHGVFAQMLEDETTPVIALPEDYQNISRSSQSAAVVWELCSFQDILDALNELTNNEKTIFHTRVKCQTLVIAYEQQSLLINTVVAESDKGIFLHRK
ncbi:MAG: hypothetical protein HRU15_10760 [Planctomycetes bacterium]|nr:hypothetical protein [Planctomycetota bacterium]